MIGMPECDVILAQCVIYLTRAPKSQLIYNAFKSAENIIAKYEGPQPAVPLHIRDKSKQEKPCYIFGKILKYEDTKYLIYIIISSHYSL